MKEKKHIDNLFQEQFQDFEAAPSPAVWNAIEAKLNEKKKDRKVLPLWWRVAGVAALIALLLTVGITLFNSDTNPSNQMVQEETTPDSTDIDTKNDSNRIDGSLDTEGTRVASEDKTVESSSSKDATVTKRNDALVPEEKRNHFNNSTQTSIATSTEDIKNNPSKNQKNIVKNTLLKNQKPTIYYNTEKEAIATINTPEKDTQKTTETTFNAEVKHNTEVMSEKEAIAAVEKPKQQNGNNTSEENKIKNTEQVITTETEVATSVVEENKKKSIFDAIEENKQLEKEAIVSREGPSNRWAIAPNVGPVYYGSLSEGSSIDPMFADNSQNGDINLSYGVQVAYDISDKLTVRTGVSNVNLSYATNDVQVASAPIALGIETIDYGNRSSNASVTTVFDRGALPTLNQSEDFGTIVPKSTGGNASISQQLRYYEVPLELKYDLLESRFGINLIGGMSTLFLGNNEVVVNDGEFRSVLGEANNLNSISFTTNIGLGFNYQLSKKLKFNIEPMFKYQLNPYTDTSIDFRPYYLGVYSGLSFKF